MDETEAISHVVERIRSDRLNYPTQGLMAQAYEGGWCVYAPAVVETDNPMEISDEPRLSVFLVDGYGGVEEIEDPDPESLAQACLWRAATAPASQSSASDLPEYPQIWGPRRATDYDRQAVDALAQALARERDFADWLARQLADLADVLGGSHTLIARRSDPLFNEHVKQLADACLQTEDGPREAWRSWAGPDPAHLPEVDTTGWALTTLEAAYRWLEATDLEAETPASRLAGAVFDQLRHIPRWRACGIVEYYPQLFPVRLRDCLADPNEAREGGHEHSGPAYAPDPDLGTVLLSASQDDPDVEALLRLALDADRRRRAYINLDLAAAAAYRRVLDRFGIELEPDIEG